MVGFVVVAVVVAVDVAVVQRVPPLSLALALSFLFLLFSKLGTRPLRDD